MASHVPFLAVRPDQQFSPEVKTRDFATTSNGIQTTSDGMQAEDTMDAPEAPYIPAPRISKTPKVLLFPLVCTLSLGLSVLLYTLVADWAGFELAGVSRDLTESWQVSALIGRKLLELGIGWFGGYDYVDLACLSILSNLPYYFLLNTFYGLHWQSVTAALLIDTISLALPFALFRSHSKELTESKLMKRGSRAVVNDSNIRMTVGVFGAAIYAAVVYSSFYTWLPSYMIVHFDGLRTLQGVHDASIWFLLSAFVPIGWSSMRFLFVPAVAASNKLLEALDPIAADPAFDPESSTFAQTVAYNLGFGDNGFSARTTVLAKRTTILVITSFINSFVRVFGTIEGTEVVGALGWSSVWAVASVLVGIAYAWVAED